MQTKQQIQQLMAAAGVSVNKRLGQHFLIDLNLMRFLMDSAQIHSSDIVLEVGCGTGSLTQAIADKAGATIAVEFDPALAKITCKQLAQWKNVEVVNCDILRNKNTINPAVTGAIESARAKCSGRFVLVSNLPYSVASAVVLNLVTGPVTADAMYVTVQKEVAERMTASPGSRDYGTLSIFLAATGDVKMIRTLKPTVFWPQPLVDSAMVSFVCDRNKAGRIENMELFGEIVSLFIGHRRKTLKACTKFAAGRLSGIDNWSEIFENCSIDQRVRPEQIRPEDYIALANICSRGLMK